MRFLPALLTGIHDEGDAGGVAFHFGNGRALAEDRASWAGEDAFATGCATECVAPGLAEVGDDMGKVAASGDVPGVRAFDFIADAYAAGAEDAAVVIDAESLVRDIDGAVREQVVVAHMVHANRDGEVLEFAVTVGDAYRADVVAFCKQQFDDHAAVGAQAFGVGGNVHAFSNAGDAGGAQDATGRVAAGADFNQAEPTCANIGESVKVTERWDADTGFACDIEQCVVFSCADEFAINGECFDCHRFIVRVPSSGWLRRRWGASRARRPMQRVRPRRLGASSRLRIR